jgi:hypothetical protein
VTITLLSRTRSGTDADGNDTYTTTETPLPGAFVYPRTSSELVQGQDTVIVGLTLSAPPGTVIHSTDRVRVGTDVYEIDGAAADWTSPFTGWDAGVQAALTKVTG